MSKKVILAAGARPNFMKIAPLYRELKKSSSITPLILHTGQHNRKNMSDVFFKDLQLPEPHISFSIKGHSLLEQSLFMKKELDKLFRQKPCDLLIVVGDVTSTFATALSGSKYGIPIAHVEAGLRSFDLSMPEETNRIFTDHLSDYLFTTSRYANENLKKEKIPESKIFFSGNVMIDTLISFRSQALKSDILSRLNLEKKEYALLTLHRPSNVDDKETLKNLIKTLNKISKKIPIVFPVHPRTSDKLHRYNLTNLPDTIIQTSPLGYLDFLNLIENSRLVMTDSGGIQEETTYLKIPCLTLRENTERPETLKEGSNILCGTNSGKLLKEVDKILKGKTKAAKIPELWDGDASKRIAQIIEKEIG